MSTKPELIFIPAPGMGHILPNIELAKRILQRNQHISVCVVCFSSRSLQVNAYVDSQSLDNSYPTRLSFVKIPRPSDLSSTFHDLQKPLVKEAIEERVIAGLCKPVGFVLNIFCTELVDIAHEFLVPSYVFFTGGATFLNFIFYTLSLEDDHGIEIPTEFTNPGFSTIFPGFKNPITAEVIPSMFQDKDMCESMIKLFRRFREVKGIIVNTYIELETNAIQPLLANDNKKIPPVYPVGPILELDKKSRDGPDNEEKELVMQWLDTQPESSVVFLCFGSVGCFHAEQVKEIANGLDRSGYRFIWALRIVPLEGKPTFLEALPEGFLDRTMNKGKIVSWAPQVQVLAHQAIGGFVSHCGWNSTLESVWFGVPMATWPMFAEQQLNAFELVKELEMATEIRIDYKVCGIEKKGNFIVTAEEVENEVKKLMCMDEKGMENVKDMSEKGKKALEEGGSSYDCLGVLLKTS